jgi:hypothetical protein
VVVFQWDNELMHLFWLVRDYMPEFQRGASEHVTLAARAASIGAGMEPVPIPWDCQDGFFAAYWRRPEAYLEERVRRGSSVWAQVGEVVETRVIERLAEDLQRGAWHERNRALLAQPEAELGASVVVAE